MGQRLVLGALLLLLSCGTLPLQGARILCLVSTAKHNNPGWTQPLFAALAARGHSLTVVSTAPVQNQSNILHIPLSSDYDVMSKHAIDKHSNDYNKVWTVTSLLVWYESIMGSCRELIQSNVLHSRNGHLMQELRQEYDLIIYDATPIFDCLLSSLPQHRQVPVLGVSSGKLSSDLLALMQAEDTINAASVPHFLSDLPQPMSYWQRLRNHILYLEEVFIRWTILQPVLSNLLQYNYLHPRVQLMLLNTHPALDYVQNMPPNIIEVGGLHISGESKPLPTLLTEFMDSHEQGIVYISLPHLQLMYGQGTAAIEHLVQQHSNYGFIFNTDNMSTQLSLRQLDNLLPIHATSLQQDIMACGDIKAFITHGDSFSLQEAVYNAVPVIVLPLLLEQVNNGQRIEERNLGITIPAGRFAHDAFSIALQRLDDEMYTDALYNAQISFRSRPLPPLEQAIWHAEQLLADPKLYDYLKQPHSKSNSYIVRHSLDVLLLPFLLLLIFICHLVIIVKQIIDTWKKVGKNKKAAHARAMRSTVTASAGDLVKEQHKSPKGQGQSAKAQKTD